MTTTPTSVSAAPGNRNLFRHPDFMKLWSAATVSLFGTQVYQIAIPVIAVLILRASPGEVGLLTTIEFLPFILFTLPAGVWVDRFPRKRILIVGDLGRAVLGLWIPVAFAGGFLSMPQLYLVGFGMGVCTVFFDIADQSYLPTVLERDQLVEGNAKLQISASSAQILGAPLGGGIVALFTAPIALVVDSISYVVSGLLILLIRRPERAGTSSPAAGAVAAEEVSDGPAAGTSVAAEASVAPAATSTGGTPAKRGSMRVEIMEGLRYIGGHRLLRSIAACTSTSNLFNQLAFAIVAVYLYRDLALTPEIVGLLGGLAGAGVLTGAVLASRLARWFGIGRTIIGSIALGGPVALLVPAAALAPALAVPLIGAAFFLGGIRERRLQRESGEPPTGDHAGADARPHERDDALPGLGHDSHRLPHRRGAFRDHRRAVDDLDRRRARLPPVPVRAALTCPEAPAHPGPGGGRRGGLTPRQERLATNLTVSFFVGSAAARTVTRRVTLEPAAAVALTVTLAVIMYDAPGATEVVW